MFEWDGEPNQIDRWEEELIDCERQINRLRSRQAELVGRLDPHQLAWSSGDRNVTDWLSSTLDISWQTASRLRTLAYSPDGEIKAELAQAGIGLDRAALLVELSKTGLTESEVLSLSPDYSLGRLFRMLETRGPRVGAIIPTTSSPSVGITTMSPSMGWGWRSTPSLRFIGDDCAGRGAKILRRRNRPQQHDPISANYKIRFDRSQALGRESSLITVRANGDQVSGSMQVQMPERTAYPWSAVVVEDRYSAIYAHPHIAGDVLAGMLARTQVRSLG